MVKTQRGALGKDGRPAQPHTTLHGRIPGPNCLERPLLVAMQLHPLSMTEVNSLREEPHLVVHRGKRLERMLLRTPREKARVSVPRSSGFALVSPRRKTPVFWRAELLQETSADERSAKR